MFKYFLAILIISTNVFSFSYNGGYLDYKIVNRNEKNMKIRLLHQFIKIGDKNVYGNNCGIVIIGDDIILNLNFNKTQNLPVYINGSYYMNKIYEDVEFGKNAYEGSHQTDIIVPIPDNDKLEFKHESIVLDFKNLANEFILKINLSKTKEINEKIEEDFYRVISQKAQLINISISNKVKCTWSKDASTIKQSFILNDNCSLFYEGTLPLGVYSIPLSILNENIYETPFYFILKITSLSPMVNKTKCADKERETILLNPLGIKDFDEITNKKTSNNNLYYLFFLLLLLIPIGFGIFLCIKRFKYKNYTTTQF